MEAVTESTRTVPACGHWNGLQSNIRDVISNTIDTHQAMHVVRRRHRVLCKLIRQSLQAVIDSFKYFVQKAVMVSKYEINDVRHRDSLEQNRHLEGDAQQGDFSEAPTLNTQLYAKSKLSTKNYSHMHCTSLGLHNRKPHQNFKGCKRWQWTCMKPNKQLQEDFNLETIEEFIGSAMNKLY